jgi:hypothetical protein
MSLERTMPCPSASPRPNRHRHLIAALAGALIFIDPAGASTPALATPSAVAPVPQDLAWNRVLTTFLAAAAGDDSAIDPTLDALAPLIAAHPGDPVLLAYQGSTVMMQARASWLPWRKMSRAEDGLALIDKALAILTPAHASTLHAGVPMALETRFVAASAFLSLPALFHRHERGQALLSDVLANPLLAKTPLSFQGAVWMRAARLAEQDKQTLLERRWLTHVVQAQAPQATLARRRLQELTP